MNFLVMLSKNVPFAVAVSGFAAAASAETLLTQAEVIGSDGYNKTYEDESKSFSDRMKGAREKPEVKVSNEKGGLHLGINGAFGPVYDAEPESSSGMGFNVSAEQGFVIQSDSWSRIEFGIQIAVNSFAWKRDDVKLSMSPLTILPRVGFGTSLGNNLYGVTKLGFGMATSSSLTSKLADLSCKTDSPAGFLMSGDYDVVYGPSAMQFTGGFGVVHHKYSYGTATCAGVKSDSDLVVNLNFVNVHAGIRLQF